MIGMLSAHGAEFKVSTDRQTAIVGENITLTLQLEGGQLPGSPNLPNIPGLQLVGTSSSQQSTLGADGKMNTVQSFAFTMAVSQPGEITIPSLQLNLNGQRLSSTPIRLKVLTNDPQAPPDSLATNLAFLWLALPKSEFYVGQAVVGEMRLYLRSEVGDIANPQIPQLTGDGFILGKYIQGQQFKRKVGEQSFTVIPMQFAATAIKSGQLKIAAVNGSVTLLGGRRDWFGGYTQRAQTTLNTDEQTFRSSALPVENTPPLFSGAVGDFTMTASVGPTNITTGDPITLRIEITGRGSLDSVSLPMDGKWDGFKTYPPTSTIESSDQFGLQGRKVFEQIISPENSDVREVPPITFSFFDPELRQFRTLTHPATKLNVRQGGVTATPVIARPANASQDAPPQQDIVPIKQRLGDVSKTNTPLLLRPGFIAWQTAPVLAFIAAFIWRKRTDSLANNPRLRRQQLVRETVRKGLENLHRCAAKNDSDEFFAGLSGLLQEKIGERLNAPASGITEAVIEEKLRPRGVPDTTLSELHDLFQTCNMARYAPVKSSQELSAIIPRLESVLGKLDEVKT